MPPEQRKFAITSLHHNVGNNVLKDLGDRVHALFAVSHTLVLPPIQMATRARTSYASGSRPFRCTVPIRLYIAETHLPLEAGPVNK
ncbi:hypothetical protein DF033_33935 [Burkholderia cenocepacia]|nr:hypothetical protein DF033_33935 [Burkholderia cenocepacia]